MRRRVVAYPGARPGGSVRSGCPRRRCIHGRPGTAQSPPIVLAVVFHASGESSPCVYFGHRVLSSPAPRPRRRRKLGQRVRRCLRAQDAGKRRAPPPRGPKVANPCWRIPPFTHPSSGLRAVLEEEVTRLDATASRIGENPSGRGRSRKCFSRAWRESARSDCSKNDAVPSSRVPEAVFDASARRCADQEIVFFPLMRPACR